MPLQGDPEEKPRGDDLQVPQNLVGRRVDVGHGVELHVVVEEVDDRGDREEPHARPRRRDLKVLPLHLVLPVQEDRGHAKLAKLRLQIRRYLVPGGTS